MKELAAAGACGFTDDGIPLKNAAFLYKAMEEAKALDLPISLHEEDPAFIETNGINHGPAVSYTHLLSRKRTIHSRCNICCHHCCLNWKCSTSAKRIH